MAIPDKFSPISRPCAGNLDPTVIKKENKNTAVAGSEAPKGSGGSQDHDAYLRQQVPVIETGISDVSEDVLAIILSELSPKEIALSAQVSKPFNSAAKQSAENQVPSLREELKQLITTSGITGIQIPESPKPIHALRVLTAFKDNLPNAISVLQSNGITDINARDLLGWTPLYLAARHGRTEIAQALIDSGADLNAKTPNGWTPLYEATQKGHTEIVKILRAAQNTQSAAAAAGGVEESKED